MALVRKSSGDSPGAGDASEFDAAVFRDRLNKAGLLSLPVDVYAIAEFLGLEVREEVMEDGLSGYIEPRRGSWIVGVNSYHHPSRQRFTVAHEIGHFVLHRPKERHVDETFARRAGRRAAIEVEADAFAADLLMPEHEVRKLIRQGQSSLEKLADYFGVSLMAIKYRVQSLGYSVR